MTGPTSTGTTAITSIDVHAEGEAGRIVGMATHPHVVLFGDRYDFLQKIRDPFPIVV